MQYRIKEIRKSKRMSQEELAKKAGVSRAILSGLETNNLSNTTANTLSKIAVALDCGVGDLFVSDKRLKN